MWPKLLWRLAVVTAAAAAVAALLRGAPGGAPGGRVRPAGRGGGGAAGWVHCDSKPGQRLQLAVVEEDPPAAAALLDLDTVAVVRVHLAHGTWDTAWSVQLLAVGRRPPDRHCPAAVGSPYVAGSTPTRAGWDAIRAQASIMACSTSSGCGPRPRPWRRPSAAVCTVSARAATSSCAARGRRRRARPGRPRPGRRRGSAPRSSGGSSPPAYQAAGRARSQAGSPRPEVVHVDQQPGAVGCGVADELAEVQVAVAEEPARSGVRGPRRGPRPGSPRPGAQTGAAAGCRLRPAHPGDGPGGLDRAAHRRAADRGGGRAVADGPAGWRLPPRAPRRGRRGSTGRPYGQRLTGRPAHGGRRVGRGAAGGGCRRAGVGGEGRAGRVSPRVSVSGACALATARPWRTTVPSVAVGEVHAAGGGQEHAGSVRGAARVGGVRGVAR